MRLITLKRIIQTQKTLAQLNNDYLLHFYLKGNANEQANEPIVATDKIRIHLNDLLSRLILLPDDKLVEVLKFAVLLIFLSDKSIMLANKKRNILHSLFKDQDIQKAKSLSLNLGITNFPNEVFDFEDLLPCAIFGLARRIYQYKSDYLWLHVESRLEAIASLRTNYALIDQSLLQQDLKHLEKTLEIATSVKCCNFYKYHHILDIIQ